MQARQFAVKKVLAQDAETDAIAEVETRLLQKLDGQPGFVRCHGVMSKQMSKTTTEHWMLLELCPHGSLVDVLYRKGKNGAFEKKPPLPTLRVLEIFEMVAAAVTHMHALSPAVTHRDLKLENVLGASDGEKPGALFAGLPGGDSLMVRVPRHTKALPSAMTGPPIKSEPVAPAEAPVAAPSARAHAA